MEFILLDYNQMNDKFDQSSQLILELSLILVLWELVKVRSFLIGIIINRPIYFLVQSLWHNLEQGYLWNQV